MENEKMFSFWLEQKWYRPGVEYSDYKLISKEIIITNETTTKIRTSFCFYEDRT